MRYSLALLVAALAADAKPILPRGVPALNNAAFEQAQQRDASATRAFSGVQIHDDNGKCLTVNKLSGDFRANLNPVQLADCDTTDGQQWDVITAGKHNNQPGKALIVNTLTQACLTVDHDNKANAVHMFSCGGRADGTGDVSTRQLFPFNSADGSFSMNLKPEDSEDHCLEISDGYLDVTICTESNGQKFHFGNGPKGDKTSQVAAKTRTTAIKPTSYEKSTMTVQGPPATSIVTEHTIHTVVVQPTYTTTNNNNNGGNTCAAPSTVTVTNEVTVTVGGGGSPPPGTTSAAQGWTSYYTSWYTITKVGGGETSVITEVPVTETVAHTTTAAAATTTGSGSASKTPVARGGFFDPAAAKKANPFDSKAVGDNRPVQSTNIVTSDNRCLSVDPLGGDFRSNNIPVALVACNATDPNQKFDLIKFGTHNDGRQNRVLVSSVVTNGCLTFDHNRPQGDTVNMFSCGGSADGCKSHLVSSHHL